MLHSNMSDNELAEGLREIARSLALDGYDVAPKELLVVADRLDQRDGDRQQTTKGEEQ